MSDSATHDMGTPQGHPFGTAGIESSSSSSVADSRGPDIYTTTGKPVRGGRAATSSEYEYKNKHGFEDFNIVLLPTDTVDDRRAVKMLTGVDVFILAFEHAWLMVEAINRHGKNVGRDSLRIIREKHIVLAQLIAAGHHQTAKVLTGIYGLVAFEYAALCGSKPIHQDQISEGVQGRVVVRITETEDGLHCLLIKGLKKERKIVYKIQFRGACAYQAERTAFNTQQHAVPASDCTIVSLVCTLTRGYDTFVPNMVAAMTADVGSLSRIKVDELLELSTWYRATEYLPRSAGGYSLEQCSKGGQGGAAVIATRDHLASCINLEKEACSSGDSARIQLAQADVALAQEAFEEVWEPIRVARSIGGQGGYAVLNAREHLDSWLERREEARASGDDEQFELAQAEVAAAEEAYHKVWEPIRVAISNGGEFSGRGGHIVIAARDHLASCINLEKDACASGDLALIRLAQTNVALAQEGFDQVWEPIRAARVTGGQIGGMIGIQGGHAVIAAREHLALCIDLEKDASARGDPVQTLLAQADVAAAQEAYDQMLEPIRAAKLIGSHGGYAAHAAREYLASCLERQEEARVSGNEEHLLLTQKDAAAAHDALGKVDERIREYRSASGTIANNEQDSIRTTVALQCSTDRDH